MMEELERRQKARRLAAMTPEERAAEENKNKPVVTGDVNAKLALLEGGLGGPPANSNVPNTKIMVNKGAPPPPPPPPPPKGMVFKQKIISHLLLLLNLYLNQDSHQARNHLFNNNNNNHHHPQYLSHYLLLLHNNNRLFNHHLLFISLLLLLNNNHKVNLFINLHRLVYNINIIRDKLLLLRQTKLLVIVMSHFIHFQDKRVMLIKNKISLCLLICKVIFDIITFRINFR